MIIFFLLAMISQDKNVNIIKIGQATSPLELKKIYSSLKSDNVVLKNIYLHKLSLLGETKDSLILKNMLSVNEDIWSLNRLKLLKDKNLYQIARSYYIIIPEILLKGTFYKKKYLNQFLKYSQFQDEFGEQTHINNSQKLFIKYPTDYLEILHDSKGNLKKYLLDALYYWKDYENNKLYDVMSKHKNKFTLEDQKYLNL